MGVHSEAYFRFWLYTYPLFLVGIVASGLEILSRVPAQYGRPREQLNRQRLLTTFQVCLLIALCSAFFEIIRAGLFPSRTLWYSRLLTVARVTTLLVGLLLFMANRFVSLVPVRFQRNLLIHARLFAVWVTLDGVNALAANLTGMGRWWLASNIAVELAASVLFVAWVVLLKRKGEEPPGPRPLSPADRYNLDNRRQEIVRVLRRALLR